MTKSCSICKIEKPLDEFYTTSQRGKTIHISHCKDCNREKDRLPKNRFSRLRAQCRRFGMPITLTVEQFTDLVSKPCHYCGQSLEESAGSSLDRIDRARGYEPGNAVPACWLCNHSKGTTFDEFEQRVLSQHYPEFHERRKRLGLPELRAPYGGKKPKSRTPGYWQTEGKRARKQRGWDHLHENEK